MAYKKNVGRQDALYLKQDIVFGDVPTAGEYELANLPEGACVLSGHIYTSSGADATGTITLTVEDKDGNAVDTLSGALDVTAVGIDAITPTGETYSVPSFIKGTTNVDFTQGAFELVVGYIVEGRACVSEG